jgi:hypothetical protein
MRTFEVSRRALSISVAAALLSACGGSSVPIATDYAIGAGGLKYHQTFSYTGSEQTFIVPAGVTQLTVVALGAKAAAGRSTGPAMIPEAPLAGFTHSFPYNPAISSTFSSVDGQAITVKQAVSTVAASVVVAEHTRRMAAVAHRTFAWVAIS